MLGGAWMDETRQNELLEPSEAMVPDELAELSELEKQVAVSELDEAFDEAFDDIDEQLPLQKERYFGSVRFFKNLILLAVIVMIAIPTWSTIHYRQQLQETQQQLADMTVLYDDMCHSEKIWYGWEAESPYVGLYPDFYAPQPLGEGVRESGVVYLTFDDGPSNRTVEVLDILKEKDVQATFFVIGFEGERNAQILKRMVEEGHTIGMHTASHNYNKIYASVEDYLADMYQIFNQIKETTGVTPTLFRFPGGSINNYNSGIYQEMVAEMLRRGFVPFDWNVSSRDAATLKLLPAETLVNNVVSGVSKLDYGIVLMHDSAAKTTTVKALDPMIDQLQEMGYELKPLTPESKSMLFAYGR